MSTCRERRAGMRLLFVSNFLPPAARGGYEAWCSEVAEGLRARGHDVHVLTSHHGQRSLTHPDPSWIRRQLWLEMPLTRLIGVPVFFLARRWRKHASLQVLERSLHELDPDAILVWGMWNLPRELVVWLEQHAPARLSYYLGDYWPSLPSQWQSYWGEAGRTPGLRLVRRQLRRLALHEMAREPQPRLRMDAAMACSEFLRQELIERGCDLAGSVVVPGAVDLAPYRAVTAPRQALRRQPRLLYVGRVVPDKGVHTLVDAVARLRERHGIDARLEIVGGAPAPYASRLQAQIDELGLTDRIVMVGTIAPDRLPQIYARSDVFVFPSIWPEPFGRVMVEAMAAGLPVVGSRVGGAAELLRPGENSLAFEAGDAESLAASLARMIEQPELRARLATTARREVFERYDLPRMVDDIERRLRARSRDSADPRTAVSY